MHIANNFNQVRNWLQFLARLCQNCNQFAEYLVTHIVGRGFALQVFPQQQLISSIGVSGLVVRVSDS